MQSTRLLKKNSTIKFIHAFLQTLGRCRKINTQSFQRQKSF